MIITRNEGFGFCFQGRRIKSDAEGADTVFRNVSVELQSLPKKWSLKTNEGWNGSEASKWKLIYEQRQLGIREAKFDKQITQELK